MTPESRITRSPVTRAMPGALKASKLQKASSVSASAPLKRHLVPVPTLKSAKGTSAKKSPSTSSSDSSSWKRGLNGGKAISNPKGTKDAPANAKVSSSEGSAQATGSVFEASNDLSLECNGPAETKRIIDTAEPCVVIPDLHLKDLDVVHPNLAVMSWFNVDDHEFDAFLSTQADQNCDLTGSGMEGPLSGAAEATATPNSLLESINVNGDMDEFGGDIGRVYSINTPLQQDKKCEGGKAVVEEFTRLRTPDGRECSKGKDSSRKLEDGSTLPETSEGTGGVELACENLIMRQAGHGLDAFRGWRAIKVLLPPSLVVLLMVLFYVDKLVEGEPGMLPPPT